MKQTTRVNGKRVVITTSAKGKVTVAPAKALEWELQAAQVRELRRHPAYGKRFLLAGDMNAAKRGPKARAQAIATGMTPGEPDLRLYLEGALLVSIENKVGNGRLSPAQTARHKALKALGFDVRVLRACNENDAVARAVAVVNGVLGAMEQQSEKRCDKGRN